MTKLIYIEWNDSQIHEGQFEKTDDFKPATMKTVGHFVSDKDGYTSVAFEDAGTDWRFVITIPNVLIKSIRELT